MPLNSDTTRRGALCAVVTTIQSPTDAVRQLIARLRPLDARLVIVGDKKGPAAYDVEGVQFLSLQGQLELGFDLAHSLPTGHYARKNIGYLVAIQDGATCIYETDDDNAPLESWTMRQETVHVRAVPQDGWVNVFRWFSSETIWPRGFPLDEVRESLRFAPEFSEELIRVSAPIQQGLANNSPDVDAIWRLILDEPFEFESGPSLCLRPAAWCPFNSQSTWWFPVAYPLMYLPSYCSFRMTDIWRSFIAQRCLWEMGLGIVFHGAEVRQERNEHDLMRDFQDEVPGYVRNKEMAATLESLELSRGSDVVGANLLSCYRKLITEGFFPEKEFELVNAWLIDIERARAY